MSLFSNKGSADTNYLGVDIGGSSIKVVELTNNNGRAQLVTYGYLERSLSGEAKLVDQPDKAAEMLKKVLTQAKTVSKRAVTALPATAVFSSVISISEITKKDLSSPKKVTEAVERAATKVLPLPLAEMILDWKILDAENLMKPKDGEKVGKDEKIKNLQVLLTGAAKVVVQKYIEVFKKAGLELISLETESFALARSLVGKDKSIVALVDIGAVNTDISIIENTIPLLNRSLVVGGLEITKQIKNSLNISLEQSEQFKRDLASTDDSEELPEAIMKPIQAIIDEVEYSINFYLEQPENKDKRVERIVLSGGTANMYNLPKIFTDKLGIRAFVGNPWARVIYPEDLQPVLESIGTRLATSLGLAMRDIDQ